MQITLTKLIKFMSLQCLIIVMIQVMTMQFLIAENVRGQNLKTTKISAKVKDRKLEEIFKVIEKNTDYVFVFPSEVKNDDDRFSFTFRNENLENVLMKIGREANLKFKVVDYTITAAFGEHTVDKSAKAPPEIKPPVPILVSGTVTDDTNETLPGVNVLVKGSNVGTSTDANGKFSLEVPDGNAILVFSFIGYATKEVLVGNQTTVDVSLAPDIMSLQEVVVVGYGTQKKLSLTGAVSNIKGDEIITTRTPSLAVALAGKIPGLQIRQQSGMPGEFNTMINVRGFGTPLFVIDGVVRDGDKEFQRINPEDIESISVLKDASAAIYGINSSNGVIIVKTKSGGTGPMKITYTGLMGISSPTEHTKMMNVKQFEEIRNEAEVNGGRAPLYSTPEELAARSSLPDVNWYDQVFKSSAFQHQHTMTVQGGNEHVSSYTSIGYMTDNGLLKSGDIGYNKYSLRSNLSAKIASNLTADVNISGWIDKRYQPGTWDDAFFYLSKASYGMIPSETVYANNNPLYFNKPLPLNDNPVAFADKDYFGYREWRNKFFQTTVALTYKVPHVKGLQLKLLGAYDGKVFNATRVQKSVKTYQFSPSGGGTYTPTNNYEPSIQEEVNNFGRADIQTQISYSTQIAKAHNVSALVVAESREENERYVGAYRKYTFYTIDNIDRASTTGQTNGGWTKKQTYQSYLGRFNYDFRDKYFMEFAFRYDGSYRYAPDKRWGFFPVMSIGWRMAEEAFIRDNLTFVSNLKLRGSYGQTGQDAGSPFQYVQGYSSSGGYVFTDGRYTNGYGINALQNRNLTWFEATTIDIGIDLTLWEGLDFTLDVYRRNRSGLLAKRTQSLPNTFGASLPDENLNKDRTDGIDFIIGYRGQVKEIEYGASFNMNFGRTKVMYQERAPFRSSWDRYVNGQAGRWQDIGWGNEVVGQFQNFDEIRNAPIETEDRANANTLPGDFIHKDVNGDGLINSKDRVPLFWNGQPKLHFGFTAYARWKGLDFNLLFQGSAMNSVKYNEILGSVLALGANSPAFYYDRWHLADPYNPDSEWIPGYWPASRKNDYDAGSTRIESNANRINAFYLRLKSVELGYTIPQKFIRPLGLQKVRTFLNGYNLVVFCDKYLKNFDPEISDGNGFSYPLSVSYNFGVNVTF